jgi:ADP-ribose pyrophosphatase
MNTDDRVRIKSITVLADDYHVLRKTVFDFQRADGSWQEQSRETYDRGNGAVILLYNLERRTVVLIRQFRFPAFANGHHGFLIEAAAGLLDGASPEQRIRAEAEEETGFRIGPVTPLWDVFMSPGSVTERLHFFTAPYEPHHQVGPGGGVYHEGEDIEVFELDIDQAAAMIGTEIIDGKTIMLLQHAQLHIFGRAKR